jgi:hypothetical protein
MLVSPSVLEQSLGTTAQEVRNSFMKEHWLLSQVRRRALHEKRNGTACTVAQVDFLQ